MGEELARLVSDVSRHRALRDPLRNGDAGIITGEVNDRDGHQFRILRFAARAPNVSPLVKQMPRLTIRSTSSSELENVTWRRVC